MLDVKALLAKMLSYLKPKFYDRGVITSNYTVRHANVTICGDTATLSFAINNGGSNFANGRVNPLGTLAAAYRPRHNVYFVVTASTSVAGSLARKTNLLINASGVMILDNATNSDVKEVNCSVTYNLGG